MSLKHISSHFIHFNVLLKRLLSHIVDYKYMYYKHHLFKTPKAREKINVSSERTCDLFHHTCLILVSGYNTFYNPVG
jgi:hypothetical protein